MKSKVMLTLLVIMLIGSSLFSNASPILANNNKKTGVFECISEDVISGYAGEPGQGQGGGETVHRIDIVIKQNIVVNLLNQLLQKEVSVNSFTEEVLQGEKRYHFSVDMKSKWPLLLNKNKPIDLVGKVYRKVGNKVQYQYSFEKKNVIISNACGSGEENPLPNIPKLDVLEIIKEGNSQLAQYPNVNQIFNIHTMRMKEFVATNEELDGKYDVIMISSGDYNPAGISGIPYSGGSDNQKKAHNTTNVLNDITNLKADQIINNFINKGQPVILHKESIQAYSNSKLYNKFNPYLTQNKPNVIGYTNLTDLKNSINAFLGGTNYVKKPILNLTSKPTDYVTNPSKIYGKGETITFDFSVDNYNPQLKANLYIDSDFNDRYDSSEIVKTINLTAATGTGNISYALPSGTSGLRHWKFEVVDNSNSLKDYEKGVVRFKDQVAQIKVLQVTKEGTTSRLNDSNSDQVMKQSYLSKDGEYLIEIDNTEMSIFNKTRQQLGNSQKKFSYESINGTYDMLIFGFADVYNGAAISNEAAQAVVNFVNSGQSVMFTHDTVFETNNNWVNNFMNITGQIAPRTNLGHGAPNPSTQTKKVNDGLITQYPFILDDNIQIATTHNQYYTLNLEDPNVIPWYNIKSQDTDNSAYKRDVDDSWNHFYTYSKGNVTYSGTGHTNNRFPDEEQRLFVNTMYRAFLGSNHAPVITVITPKENDQIPTSQNIWLNFKVEDLDLNDRLLTAKVKVDGKEIQLDNDGKVYSGESISKEIPHGLQADGTVNIEIEVTDKKGATAKKVFPVVIKKISEAAVPTREIVGNNLVEFGSTVELNYKVNSKEITLQNSTLPNELKVTNVKYEEIFPANIEIKTLPQGFTKNTRADGTTLVQGPLADIVFEKVGNIYKPKNSEISFTIKVSPKANDQDGVVKYNLDNAQLSFKELDSTNNSTINFNPLVIDAAYKIDSVSLGDDQLIYLGGESLALKPLLTVSPAKAYYQIVSWNIANSNIVGFDVDSSGNKIESISAKANGQTTVTVKVKDAFGTEKTATLNVKVYTQVTGISVNPTELDMFVGEEKQVTATVEPANASNKNVTWTSADPSVATVVNGKVKAEGIGSTEITVTTEDGDFSEYITVNVEELDVVLRFTSAVPKQINIGDTLNLSDSTYLFRDPQDTPVTWSSSKPSTIHINHNTGVITAKSAGYADITVTSTETDMKATVRIYVKQAGNDDLKW